MNLLKEAFIEGYKQRAEGSDLIFDNASRMYAISLFDKYQAEQLTLTDVSFELPSDEVFDMPEVDLKNPLEEFYYYERPPYLKSDQKDFKERLQKALNYLKARCCESDSEQLLCKHCDNKKVLHSEATGLCPDRFKHFEAK